ncbi:hypothetical protein [Nostoc sp.]|uniref:hypothetical protein n=1 Tax=Nostoc sp. TaxID=1180 RepID=UPI002FFAF43C
MGDRFFSTIDDTTQCFLYTSLQAALRTCAIALKNAHLDQQAQTYTQKLERSLLASHSSVAKKPNSD